MAASLTASGLVMPASQSAAGDTNTLDDYEEGSFTAGLTGTTGAPSATCNSSAWYTKIGNLIFINIRRFSAINVNGASGSVKITGLPFSTGTTWCTTSMSCYRFEMAQDGNTAFEGYADYMIGLESHDYATWTDWGIAADGNSRYMAITGIYHIP